MVLQVGAVRHKLPDAMAEDRDALRSVERAGRTALAEMRRLLGAMRSDGDEVELGPQPGLDGLDSLLAEVGVPTAGPGMSTEPALPPRSTCPRIESFRKGLTNALKHARARAT
jgi:signal transduction histidine kinase